MRSILFLGYSNLVKNRILPIVAKAGFTRIAIAKYAGQPWDDAWQSSPVPVTRYDDYETGLDAFSGEWVYVSTVNSSHVACARASLARGFHTIIDKPATESFSDALDLVTLARSKRRFLGESTVYLCHPQLSAIRQVFDRFGDTPKLLTVHFTMPPFQPDNFRYQRGLGGGAIMDTAPYAVSVGRYFFGTKPVSVTCEVTERREDGLDIEYSLLMTYPGGRALIGHFGFNTEYMNQLQLLGTRTNVTVNRIYTIPDTLRNTLFVRHLNQESELAVEPGNSFLLYLAQVLHEAGAADYEASYRDLLLDAEVREMIMKQAEIKQYG